MAFNLTKIVDKYITVRNEGYSGEPVLLHNGTTNVSIGETINIGSKYSTVYLSIHGFEFNLRCMVSKDNVNWVCAPLTDTLTGKVYTGLNTCGTYAVTASGYNYLRCPVFYCAHNLTVTAIPSYEQFTAPEAPLPPIPSHPVPLRCKTETTIAPSGFISDIYTENGSEVLYSFTGSSVYRCTEGGTKTLIHTFDGMAANISFVKKLENGKLLVMLNSGAVPTGKVFISDTEEKNFTQIYSFTREGAVHSNYCGKSFYKNICLLCENGANGTATSVHASFDGGNSFTEIFNISSYISAEHSTVLDACYDPYSDVIWVSAGGKEYSNIYYSRDHGRSWNTVYSEQFLCPAEFSQIAPLPYCVLFMSTSVYMPSVYRLDRLAVNRDEMTGGAEPVYFLERCYSGSAPIAVSPAISYGENAAVYFGWSETGAVSKYPAKVIGTPNGYDFYTVWESDSAVAVSDGYTGIQCVCGESDNGNIAVCHLTQNGSTSSYGQLECAIIPSPKWHSSINATTAHLISGGILKI